jgi:hypothetical protein
METSDSEEVSKKGRQFLLGRWTGLLEQCLKLLGEKFLASTANGDLFFDAKLKDTLHHLEKFCEQLASGWDLGGEEFADNRFCELAVNYFRLRLRLLSLWTGDGDYVLSPSEKKFVQKEYRKMFPRRPDGRGRSLEFRPLEIPSLGWLREGAARTCFRLVQLTMTSLIEVCVLRELDFFEIENLGMGSGKLELYRQRGYSASGSASEQEAAQFWMELAASLLANAVAIERSQMRGERRRARQVPAIRNE